MWVLKDSLVRDHLFFKTFPETFSYEFSIEAMTKDNPFCSHCRTACITLVWYTWKRRAWVNSCQVCILRLTPIIINQLLSGLHSQTDTNHHQSTPVRFAFSDWHQSSSINSCQVCILRLTPIIINQLLSGLHSQTDTNHNQSQCERSRQHCLLHSPRNCSCCCWSLLRSAVLCFWADSQHFCRLWFWVSDSGLL